MTTEHEREDKERETECITMLQGIQTNLITQLKEVNALINDLEREKNTEEKAAYIERVRNLWAFITWNEERETESLRYFTDLLNL